MLIKYKERYSILFRAISLAVVSLFIYNDLAFALAPKLFVSQEQMRNEYLLKSFLLSHDAVNKYIGTRINPDSLINVDITGLDCYRPDNMVVTIGELKEEQPIGIVAIEGLLKNTGQLAHLGLGNKNGLPVIYVDSQYFYAETVISHEKDKIAKWEALRNLKGFTYAEMRRWIKRCIDHPDTVEKKTSRQIAEEIHSRSLNHDKINKLYEDIRRKYNNFIEAGLDDEARALLDMAKMFELYKDAEYTLDKDDIDINIAAHESPAGPDISKIDPVLEGLIHDDSFIELFNKAVKKNTDVPKDKIAPLLESCVKADDISVLRYDDATLLVVSREGKPYRIVRYASNSYVDYLSAPRLDPNESHFANISDNGFKFEVLRDRPEVLADYIDDITMYYENPILRPIVEEISSGEYYNLREAVLHLRGIAYEFKGSSDEEHKKIGQHALKLLHSLMYHENKGIRVEANRVLHDIYTDRPEDFPLTKSYKTVLQGQPQTIEVACRKGETEGRIQWSINGVMQEPIKMSKSSGSTKFSAVVPVDTGTIHYAVEVKLARTWRYKVGLGNESQVSGVIKTQKDMRGKHILEVRTAIFDLAKGEDGKPVWNKDGSLSISNFDQLRKLLPELKKRYDAIWLMDCFEWGPVCYPGKDPSSFAPIDHITIAASLGGEEALDRLRQEAKSGEKKIDLIHNLIPHISQSNTTLPAYFPVYRFDGPRLVRHNSSDGQGDWDDSFQPNWRRKEVLDRYESMVMRLAKKGDSFRADVAHAFDTTFQVDNGAVGMARIFGDIVTNQRRDNGDGCFKTTDLSGTGEPNVILSRLAYEIQANAPNSLIYGENFATKTEDRGWQANDERLIKSGIVPYNSLHEELAHVLRDSRDVSGIIDHMVYRKWVHDQFGGQDVTVYASHDYQRDPQIPDEIYRDRPPLQLYGDGIIPFMATIFLLDYHGPILWHFARLLGDESDDFSKRHNLSLAEFWKIWVNNIRQFDYEGAVQASRAYLKDNPHLNALGDYAFALKNMLEKYDVMRSSDAKMVRHDSDCMSVLKSKGNEAILGFINYGYHNKDIFRPLPELSNIKDDQMYELEELFRYSKNEGFSKSPPIYLSGNELRNLGLHESLSAWETVIYSIKPVKVELYTLNILRQSMVNYKNFGVEDRVKYSLVSSLLKDSIENRDFIRFKDVLVKMINIARHTHGLEIGDVATVLYDISRYYPEYKDEITDQITGIALEDGSDQDMDIRYDAVRVLRGMQIGEVAMASVETRDIAGLGGLALYIKDIAMALVDMGLDTTIFTNIFNYNREGNKIFQSIVHNANLKYTGKSIVVPYYGESHDTISHFNRAYIYHTMLGGKVRTYALHNDRYGDVLYGGITAEDLVRRYRFFALGALEAIRTVNVHPSVLQTNEGATGFAIPYLTLPEYGYLSNDTHFSGLRVKVHANHNLDHNYQNIVTGDNQGHKRDLMRIAGLNPDNFEHHMLISADAKSREINPTYAANNRSDYSLAVSPGYRDYTANNSASLGLGDLMRSKRDNGRYAGEQNGIDTVTWQKKILRQQTFFECKDRDSRQELFQRVRNNIKPAAKNELQEMLGLNVDGNVCLFTMLHRLCEQKGYEIAIDAIRDLLDNNADAQVAIGGPAEDSDQGRWFKGELEKIQNDARYKGRFKYVGGVSPNSRLYELIYLGADVFLMPSKFEPAGLSQLEALAAGAVVVARDVDGLSTSITDVTEADRKGIPANGFKFFDFNSAELKKATERTLAAFRERYASKGTVMSEWDKLSYNAFTYDSRWIRPAKRYINNIFAKNMGVDMERIADFPELLLIFAEPENLEKRLIEHGFNKERGLDYVLEDAIKELSKIVNDDTEKRSLVKELARKYYERYRSYLPATVSGMRTTDRSDEIIDAGPGTRFYKTPENRASTPKNAIENPKADYASARRMVEELLDLYNNMESLAKDANKTKDAADKAGLKKDWISYLDRIKDIYDSIGIKVQEWDEYSYYKKELERIGNHISSLYGNINRAFESNDKDSLFRLNKQLIESNRKRMKYQLKAALLIAEGKSGLKDPKMIRNAACKAVQGGLYSCQRLVEELGMRGARLETMAKMYEFRLGDLNLQIERGYGDKEVYRKKGWIRVGSRLVRARRSFKAKKYDDALSTLAVLSDVYSGKALQMPEKYREALELINGLIGWVRDVSLGRSPPDSEEFSHKISVLNNLVGEERHKVWQVIETKSILTAKIDTIKSVQLQFIEASRVKTFLEYYIERINWALQTKAGRLSKRSRQMILTGLVNVQEWLEAGMVDEKHESAQDMGPAIDYLKREQDRAAKESLVRIRERIGKRAADLDAQRQALEKQISERKAPLQSASQAAPTAEENMPGPASGQISFALRCKLVQELITSQPGLAENITALIAAVTEQRPSVLEGVREADFTAYVQRILASIKEDEGFLFYTASEPPPMADMLSGLSYEDKMELSEDLGLTYLLQKAGVNEANKSVVECIRNAAVELKSGAPDTFNVYRLKFASTYKTPYPENQTVLANYYVPKEGEKPFPTVVVASHMSRDAISRPISLYLVRNGFAVLEVTLPFYGSRTPRKAMSTTPVNGFFALDFDTRFYLEFFEQSVADMNQAVLWLRTRHEVDKDRIGIVGQSKAGTVASLVYSTNEYVKYLAAVSPLVDHAASIWDVKEEYRVRDWLEKKGVTRDSFAKATRSVRPSYIASKGKKDPNNILLAASEKDNITPFAYVEDLWFALGRPRIIVLGKEAHSKVDHLFGFVPNMHELFPSIANLFKQAPAPQAAQKILLGNLDEIERMLNKAEQLASRFERKDISPKEASAYLQRLLVMVEDNVALIERNTGSSLEINKLAAGIADIYHTFNLYDDARMKSDIARAREKARMIRSLLLPAPAADANAEAPYKVTLQKIGADLWRSICSKGTYDFTVVEAGPKTPIETQQAFHRFIKKNFPNEDADWSAREAFAEYKPERKYLLLCKGEVVGYYQVWYVSDLQSMFVEPDYRGTGAADVLIRHIFEYIMKGNKEKKIKYQITRNHHRAAQGPRSGTTDDLRRDLGLNSIVEILSAPQAEPTPQAAPASAAERRGASTQITVQCSDGKPIQVYFDPEGILRSINDIAKENGLKIYFAGGIARNMLLGKTGFVNKSDVDIVIRRPVEDIEEDEVRQRIAKMKEALRQKYPKLPVDIINLDQNGYLLEEYYEKFEGSRVATISRMLVGEEGNEWVVSSGGDDNYLQDVREKRLKLVPRTDKFGTSFSPGMDSVLRFVRLRAEFPDLAVDASSQDEINSFIADNFIELDKKLSGLSNAARNGARTSNSLSFDDLVKASELSQNSESLKTLLKSTGREENNLYNLLSRHTEYDEIKRVLEAIADPVPQAASVVGVTQLVPVRNFGKTGLSFPVLGIGTVWFGRQWPPDDSSYAYPEFDEVRNYLDGVFADLGNNSRAIMIDTAAAYGSTEEVIGKYFRERPDLFSKAFIATKWGEEYDISTGKSDIDHSKERLIASTKRSLERLGKMDLLYIHGATLEVLSNGEVMEEMRRMKDVHYGGLSLIGASISREDVLEGSVRENLIEGLDVIQMPGSVFLNRPDLVNAIYEKGIAIVINSPIRKGDKRTPGAIYADLLGHRELSVILTGTRHHLRDNIEYCLPAPQAASAAAAEDEKLKGKGSPADLLELIKDTPELMQKALDWKGLGGITEQDIAKVRPYSGRTIRRELKTLDNLIILVQASRTGNYRFDRKMLGPDIDHTKTLINAINDIRYMAGKQGDERPMHRGAIDPSKMGTVKALVKMAVFKELNNGYLPAHEKDKILWHIIERGVIPREQGDTIVTQINKAFRDNDLPERIWILDENKNTSEAIAEIRAKFPNSIIDVALASKDSINKMPDDDQVKMLVFRGCHDFVQLEGVIAALRALHSQDALARLRHIYLIMTDHIFAGELPSASDSIKEFARKFAFDLPPAENAPINDIPELNKRLLALLTAA